MAEVDAALRISIGIETMAAVTKRILHKIKLLLVSQDAVCCYFLSV